MKFKITQEQVEATLNYLIENPWKEVNGLVAELSKLEKIEEKEDKKEKLDKTPKK